MEALYMAAVDFKGILILLLSMDKQVLFVIKARTIFILSNQ